MSQERKCHCGKDSLEGNEMYLCEDCDKLYDQHKFWIKNQFQFGKWHRLNEFYHSEDVRRQYLKDDTCPEDCDWVGLDLFLTAYASEYDHGNMHNAKYATILQIIREMEDALM